MANTILITANWHTGALSQQTISRQYDNNRYVVQFVGYPEASEGNELDYYLLVWMSSAPGERPDEIAPIQLASDQWYISNVFTQQTQQIKFQMCALNTEGTFEAHSPIFTGFVRNSLEHDGTAQDIDVSTLFDAYREYLNELIIRAGAVVIDPTLSQSGQAADAGKVGIFKEYTRNLNVSEMGQYGNASNGHIANRDGHYYGMKNFISVDSNTTYTISVGGVSGTNPSMSILQINNDSTFNRSGYANINNRTITTGANAIKLHVHIYSADTVLTLSNPFIQIEKGDNVTNHIIPISAIDAILREEKDYPTFVFKDAVGAMVDVAKTYFDIAYGDNTNLVYDSTHGLFALQTTSDNAGEEDMPAIVCSMLAWAMMKGITYKNSRYVNTLNHIAQWGYISDGKEQTTQDGEQYSNSYYNYLNGSSINTDDYPSYDYMLAAETYRYALNHGWAYDIDTIRPQLRAGDFVFSVNAEEGQYKYKNITHIALVLFVGQDNDRVILLESNTFTYGNRTNVGVGIRYATISSLSYGARFPVGSAPYEVSLVEKAGAFSGESEAGTYNFKTIFTKTHEKGFYTVIMEGNITTTANANIGVVYDNDTSTRKYYRLMIQGNKIIGFFYAPSSFRNITLAGDPVVTYDITGCNLYKGYMPC